MGYTSLLLAAASHQSLVKHESSHMHSQKDVQKVSKVFIAINITTRVKYFTSVQSEFFKYILIAGFYRAWTNYEGLYILYVHIGAYPQGA